MDATQNTEQEVGFLIMDALTGEGIEDIAWDDPGLLITYRKPGGDIAQFVPALTTWEELQYGTYMATFGADIFDTLGMLPHWAAYPGALKYPGLLRIVKCLTGPGGPARLPILVRSTVDGSPLADCLVKLRIVDDLASSEFWGTYTNSEGYAYFDGEYEQDAWVELKKTGHTFAPSYHVNFPAEGE